MTTTRSIQSITADLMAARREGATIPTVAGSTIPPSGYVVGLAGHGITLANVTRKAIASWVASHLAESVEPMHALGIWQDQETQVTYLDVVQILAERATAETLARKTGELAIYDLARKTDIRV